MALTFNQLSSLTTNKFMPKLIDNVFASKAFIARLTRPGQVQLMDGGIKLQGAVVESEPGTTGRWYSGYETIVSEPSDDITAWTLDWKQLQEPVKISRRELLQNMGDSAKLSLLRSKMEIAQKNVSERLGQGLNSDGTAATGDLTTKQIDGLGAIMSESSTYAGIAVADMATWAAYINDNSATLRPLTLNLMQDVFGGCSVDSDVPTVAQCRQNVYNQAWSLYQPHQRLMSEEMAKLGFRSLEFNGIPIIIDSHAAANSIDFINENHVYLVSHREQNFRIEKFDKLETFDGILNRIVWMGNLVCDARRLNGRLSDIAV